jgi:DHA2 family multidrug resistance protein-like MFS transporter
VLVSIFVQRQRVLADPLVDLHLFRLPVFNAAMVMYTLGIFVSFGAFLFIAQYLQLVIGLSPVAAGAWSVPGAIASIVGSNVAPLLVRRIRPGIVVAGGLMLAAIGFALLTQTSVTSLVLVVIGWTIISLGFGITFTISTDLVVGSAPPERAGAASALTETGAELGGALGIAVFGSLGVAIYRSQVAAALPSNITPTAAKAAQDTLGGVVALAEQLPTETSRALLETGRAAFTQGLRLTSVIAAVVMAGLALMAVTVLRDAQMHSESDEVPEAEPAVAV